MPRRRDEVKKSLGRFGPSRARKAGIDSLHDRDAVLLWGRAGGYCANPGCRRPVTTYQKSTLMGVAGQRAHIVGRRPTAARGDPNRSARLAAALENHILLCVECHTQVDSNPAMFPEETIRAWKRDHEARVASLLSVGLVAQRTVALHVHARFGAGEGRSLLAPADAMLSATLQSNRYFDDPGGRLTIDADTFRRDSEQDYWQSALDELTGCWRRWMAGRGGISDIEHLTVFASGPIPVLIALGRLIGDTRPVDVRDFDRQTSSWRWPDMEAAALEVTTSELEDCRGPEIRLVVELSGVMDREAQHRAVGKRLPEIRVGVSDPRPGLVRGPDVLPGLRSEFQRAMEFAKRRVGDTGRIHLFAAVPASAAVAFGQSLFPKAMPRMDVYDNNVAAQGWRRALSIEHGMPS